MSVRIALVILLAVPARMLAQSPDELLNKAIQEKNARTPAKADPSEAQKLLSEADRLAEQRKFDDAIALYEKAYRMNPSDQNGYLRMLIAKRAAGRMSESDREALQLIESQRSLKVEEIIRSLRLNLLQAREALRSGDADLALSRVEAARAAMKTLPRDVDVSVYRHELDRMASAAKSRARRDRTDEPVRMSDSPPPASSPWEGADMRPAEATPRYAPDGGIIPSSAFPMPDDPIYRFQRELDAAIRNTRAIAYFGVDAANIVPHDTVTMPDDFPEKSARRTRFQDGEIYRGPVARNADGQDEYTAVYDIGDLVRPIPDLYGIDGDVGIYLNSQLDRDAIRRRSMMFAGYADDLAAGIPVLQFYGGINNWAVNPRTDPFELERVLRTIDTFVGRHGAPPPAPAQSAPTR